MNVRTLSVLCAFATLSFACGATTDASDGVETSQSSTLSDDAPFTVSLSSTSPTVDLGQSVDVDVTVTPVGDFAGTVALGVTGLTPGVNAAPVSVSVASTIATAKLTLTADVTANVTPRDMTVPITVTATSGSSVVKTLATFKVMPKLTIYIPRNVEALYNAPGGPLRAEWGEAFGPNNKPLRTQADNPIVISIFNNDTKPHIIHGPSAAFPHGDLNAPIQPNAFEMKAGAIRTRTLKVGDSATAYIHGENNSQNASFKVAVAAAQ
jgi:hypothetical protein